MTTQPILPLRVQNILCNLQFLALQEKNKKICTNRRAFVEADSWIGAFYRNVYGEDRKKLLDFLRSTLNEYKETLYEFPMHSLILTEYLNRLKQNGFHHIRVVYSNDVEFISQLNVIESMLNIMLTIDVTDTKEIKETDKNEKLTIYSNPFNLDDVSNDD